MLSATVAQTRSTFQQDLLSARRRVKDRIRKRRDEREKIWKTVTQEVTLKKTTKGVKRKCSTTNNEKDVAEGAPPKLAKKKKISDDVCQLVMEDYNAFDSPEQRKAFSNSKAGGNAGLRHILPEQRRLFRELVKREIVKVTRERIKNHNAIVALNRKAIREAARLHRQTAMRSHKLGREFVQRNKRLAREALTFVNSAPGRCFALRMDTDVVCAGNPGPGRSFHFGPSFSDIGKCVGLAAANGSCSNNLSVVQEERLARKRAERLRAEQLKAERELWEAQRNQRKLNFLIKRTELYSHFMAKKGPLINEEVGVSDDLREECEMLLQAESETLFAPLPRPTSCANIADEQCDSNADPELEHLKQYTISTALNAVGKQKDVIKAFDNSGGTEAPETSIEEYVDRGQPKLFKGELKRYQLKGMNWLLSLYQQGINGILADEMGLGKTIQTIALFAALTEPPFNLWGPFLVVAPASTLHNWVQEFSNFLPDMHVTPYWGTNDDRRVLRKYWARAASETLTQTTSCYGGAATTGVGDCSDEVTDFAAMCEGTSAAASSEKSMSRPLNIVISSYQVVVQDARMIGRIPWQYLVLDEAHAIKSTTSLRWNTLLSLKCRNRLLLSGTPIQNTMRELWALLHFIMPTLFDNHEEFNEWFSKDIETQAGLLPSSGSTATSSTTTTKLSDNQLTRLHMILKPFMLRRLKSDVEDELLPKVSLLKRFHAVFRLPYNIIQISKMSQDSISSS